MIGEGEVLVEYDKAKWNTPEAWEYSAYITAVSCCFSDDEMEVLKNIIPEGKFYTSKAHDIHCPRPSTDDTHYPWIDFDLTPEVESVLRVMGFSIPDKDAWDEEDNEEEWQEMDGGD